MTAFSASPGALRRALDLPGATSDPRTDTSPLLHAWALDPRLHEREVSGLKERSGHRQKKSFLLRTILLDSSPVVAMVGTKILSNCL